MDFLEKSIIFLTRVGKMLKGGKSGFFRVGLLEFSRHSIAFVYHVFVCLIYYICKIDFLGQGKNLMFPVSLYFHIYG